MIYNDLEFNNIISDILDNKEFLLLDSIKHHGITRLNHSLRIAYYSYKISKLLKRDYVKVTRAALLHDFFTHEVDNYNMIKRLVLHPQVALNNSLKYYELDSMQKDIILSHMFPVTIKPPKYFESVMVDIIDDVASIYERFYSTRLQLKNVGSYILIFLINVFKFIK